jgi:hypothetical protein
MDYGRRQPTALIVPCFLFLGQLRQSSTSRLLCNVYLHKSTYRPSYAFSPRLSPIVIVGAAIVAVRWCSEMVGGALLSHVSNLVFAVPSLHRTAPYCTLPYTVPYTHNWNLHVILVFCRLMKPSAMFLDSSYNHNDDENNRCASAGDSFFGFQRPPISQLLPYSSFRSSGSSTAVLSKRTASKRSEVGVAREKEKHSPHCVTASLSHPRSNTEEAFSSPNHEIQPIASRC